MNNTRVQRRQSRKRSCRRNRRQLGGGLGLSHALGSPLVSNNPGLGAEVVPFSSCGNATPSGYLSSVPKVGLPGLSGGGYSSVAVGGINPYMDRTYSGCGEGAFAVRNPLNEAAASTITAPPSLLKGGRRRRLSGGGPSMHGSPVDGMVYEAPRSGYTYGGVSGSPPNSFAINQPYAPQATVSSSCTKTGGRRRSHQRKNRSRKSRRCWSRKNRR